MTDKKRKPIDYIWADHKRFSVAKEWNEGKQDILLEVQRIIWADEKKENRKRGCSSAKNRSSCNQKCLNCNYWRGTMSLENLPGSYIPHNDRASSVEAYIETQETYELLKAAIEALDEIDRRIVGMIYMGYTEKRMAEELKVPKSTLQDRKQRLYLKLREELEKFL